MQHVALVNTSDSTFVFPGFNIVATGTAENIPFIYGTFVRPLPFMRVYAETVRLIDLVYSCERHTGETNVDVLVYPFDEVKYMPKLLDVIIKQTSK